MFKEITSRENSLIKHISQLQNSSKRRKESGSFVLEGLRICKDAFENGIVFDKLIISHTAKEKLSREISLLQQNAGECFLLPDSLFKKLCLTDTPQGILAEAEKRPQNGNLKSDGKYIALENIGDPSNLGAIARSCEALGADGIIMSADCCDPYSPKSLRASMGTLLRIPLTVFEDFSAQLKATGLKTYACVVDSSATPITQVKFGKGSAVLIGNEANGLSPQTVAQCDVAVTIPMKGRAESLNASVAGAIAIWEMMK